MHLHGNSEANTVTATFGFLGLKSNNISIEVYQSRLTVSGEINKRQCLEWKDGTLFVSAWEGYPTTLDVFSNKTEVEKRIRRAQHAILNSSTSPSIFLSGATIDIFLQKLHITGHQ